MKVLLTGFLFLSSVALANGFSSVGAVNGVAPTGGDELQPIEDLLPDQVQEIKDANDMLSVASQHFSESAQAKIQELSEKMRARATEDDPAQLSALNSEIQALENAIKAEATAAELRAAQEFYVELQSLDDEARQDALVTPQDQDPDNPFYIRASNTSAVWNRSIQLSAYGGMNGAVSYHKTSGNCLLQVDGLVLSGGSPTTCTFYAKRTASAGFFQQSDPITVSFTNQCEDEGVPLTAEAATSTAIVGQSISITASGGGCDGVIQFYEADAYCDVTSGGVVTARAPGDCRINVTKAWPDSINPAQQQFVTVTFTPADPDSPLQVSASSQDVAANGEASLTVTGGVPGTPLFSVNGQGCQVNSSGIVRGGSAATCHAIVTQSGQSASVCIDFGGGGANPPVACLSAEVLNGPLTITPPSGPVALSEGTLADDEPYYYGGYQLSAIGGGSGTLRFEGVGNQEGCTIGQNGNVTVSTREPGLTCTVEARRFGGPEGTVVSTNSVTIVFGDADADASGSEDFQPLTIASPVGQSANVGESIALTFTGGRSGNPTFGNADLPTGCEISTSGVITRGTPGLCHVSAYDNPETSNALCIAFGDVTISADGTCVEVAGDIPTLAFSASSETINAPGNLTFTATLSRNLVSGESIEIYAVPVGGVNPLSGNCFHGGNQEYPFINEQTPRSEHVRTMYCQYPGTFKLKAVLNWLGDSIEETVCVRYGAGSPNAECPALSSDAGS